jgi:DNA mismatch endonuclease (patch repair protein)
MSRIRGKNSKAEIIVRRMIHAMGFRFRLHDVRLPGKPDLVFPRFKKVIFVHGCFWHRHDCHLGRLPKSRLDFWLPKLQKNKERDHANRVILSELGWGQMIVWECELRDNSALRRRLTHFLGGDKCAQSNCSRERED